MADRIKDLEAEVRKLKALADNLQGKLDSSYEKIQRQFNENQALKARIAELEQERH